MDHGLLCSSQGRRNDRAPRADCRRCRPAGSRAASTVVHADRRMMGRLLALDD
jgi:hypothetical protein